MLSTLSLAGARVHKKPKFPSMLKMLRMEGRRDQRVEGSIPGCRLADRGGGPRRETSLIPKLGN